MDSFLLPPTSLKHINLLEMPWGLEMCLLSSAWHIIGSQKIFVVKWISIAAVLVIPKEDNNLFPQIHFSLLSCLLSSVFVYSQSISLLRRLQPGCIRVWRLVCWTPWLTTEIPNTLSKSITGSTLNSTTLKIISSRFTLKYSFSQSQQDSCEFFIFRRPENIILWVMMT